MAFTPPDPLNKTAKTRSIFITELQDLVNEKRNDIGQSAITTFIDQSIGKTMRLSAIEQLKTLVNQLAIDFGFSGGVTNSELLGRDYVEITKKFGREVAHFPIINDLRQVLDALVPFAAVNFVGTKWFIHTGNNPTAGWIDVADPWASNPIVANVFASGGPASITCVGGDTFLVDCDNNIGQLPGFVVVHTDKYTFSQLSSGSSRGRYGPFPDGPFKANPGWNLSTNKLNMDNTHFYTGASIGSGPPGPTGIKTEVTKRDQRIPVIDLATSTPFHQNEEATVLGTIDGVQTGNAGTFQNMPLVGISGDTIYFVRPPRSAGSIVFFNAFIGGMSKSTGAVTFGPIVVPKQDITGTGPQVVGHKYSFGTTWAIDKNGNLVGTYNEYVADDGSGNTHGGSAIMTISSSGTISLSDIETNSAVGVNLDVNTAYDGISRNSQFPVNFGGPVGSGANGVYIPKSGSTKIAAGNAPNDPKKMTNNGSFISETDYRGQAMPGTGRGQFYSSDVWVALHGAVPVYTAPAIASLTRDLENNEATMTFIHSPGAFRYRVQKKASIDINFSQSGIIVELANDVNGVFDPGNPGSPFNPVTKTLFSIDSKFNYTFKILAETAQGDIFGTELSVLTSIPGIPVLDSVVAGSPGELLVSWTPADFPDAIDFEISFKRTFFPDPLSTLTETGTSRLITGLSSGTSYDFFIKARNDAGFSAASNTVAGIPS